MKQVGKKKPNLALHFSIMAVLFAILIALNGLCAYFAPVITEWVCGYSTGSGSTEGKKEGTALCELIQSEGSVLVRNNEDVLPLNLSKTKRVNVFGWSSTSWVYGGSGSGQVINPSSDLLKSLKKYGVEYNEELAKAYKSFQQGREVTYALASLNSEFNRLYEPSISDSSVYSKALLDQAKSFSDTAIVVLSRVSGESNDAPKIQYKRVTKGGAIVEDKERTYLEISTEEEELLQYVGANYDKVVVIVNSLNVMELGFMETIPGLDACLIVGGTGTAGANAIPQLLYGEKNPSGRTADTYAYRLNSNPTYVNTGSGNDTVNLYVGSKNTMYPSISGITNSNGGGAKPYEGRHTSIIAREFTSATNGMKRRMPKAISARSAAMKR